MQVEDAKAPAMDDMDSLTNFDNINSLDGVDGMDGMDDLFLDSGPAIAMDSVAPVKGLPQRLEELQMSGCSQNIAWSIMGCIAYITPDRLRVEIQAFTPSFHSVATTLKTSVVHDSAEIVHLSWDRLGSNLAVLDSLGRVSIFRTMICLNQMVLTGKFIPDPNEPFSTIVGLEWTIPQARTPHKICHSATEDNDTWSYNLFADPWKSPSHPYPGSHGITVVDRGAKLRLIYAMVHQDPDNSYSEVSTPLLTNVGVDDLLTHASCAPTQDDTMLLATYDISQTLRIFRIAIDWNYPYAANQKPPTNFKLIPTLKATRLHVLQGCVPAGSFDAGNQPRLTHFHFLPSLDDSISDHSMRNEIFGVFTVNDTSSQVWRWEIQEGREELQPCFQQLAPKKHKISPSSLEPKYAVIRRKDIDIQCAVVSVVPFRLNTMLAFCRSDGVIEIRERISMDQILPSPETGSIRLLTNAGFIFPHGDPCLSAALSPNACIVATNSIDDGTSGFTIRHVEQHHEYGTSSIQAFALTFVTASLQNHNNDDLLEIIRRTHRKYPVDCHKLLDEMYIAVRASDAALDTDYRPIMQNHALVRCFGIQLDLGPLGQEPDRSSDFAWILLNTRFFLMALHVAWETAKRDEFRPELPASLLGPLKWYVDTIIYIVGDLVRLSAKANNPEAFQQHVSSPKNLAVRLILSNICRIFFRSIVRYLRYAEEINKSIATQPPRTVQAWRTLVHAIGTAPVDIFKFDAMLAEIDHYVRNNYEQAGTSDHDRMAVERALLLSASVPAVLMPVAERLATSTLSKLMDEIRDPGRVVFADTSWLWMVKGDGPKARTFDVMRKVPLPRGKPVRRCTRCERYMEHLEPRTLSVLWIMQMQRQCLCGSPWVAV